MTFYQKFFFYWLTINSLALLNDQRIKFNNYSNKPKPSKMVIHTKLN